MALTEAEAAELEELQRANHERLVELGRQRAPIGDLSSQYVKHLVETLLGDELGAAKLAWERRLAGELDKAKEGWATMQAQAAAAALSAGSNGAHHRGRKRRYR